MLQLIIKTSEDGWDAKEERFVDGKEVVLELEHSLVSLSKWESKYKKPFLGLGEKTVEETRGYVEAMFVDPNTPPEILEKLEKVHYDQINAYIEDSMTATTINEPKSQGAPREIITSELVYYWMTTYQIPWEAEHWHLNRLFMLIRVFNNKNGKQKKMGRGELAAHNRRLNAERRAKYNTSG